MMYDYYYGNYGSPEHMFFGGFFMICFLVVIGLVVAWFIHGGRHGRHGCHGGCCGNNSSSALEILKERYAKGEIMKEEFETKKKDLEG